MNISLILTIPFYFMKSLSLQGINAVTKEIMFKFYISPVAKAGYSRKGRTIEVAVASVIDELERALNSYLMQTEKPVSIKFSPVFYKELPSGVNLDKCDTDMTALADMLNTFNKDDSMTSSIILLSCSAQPYNATFKAAGLNVPYITHSISTQCTTRSIMFLEYEEPKFLSVLSTTLMRAAGINIQNPLMFEEVTDGDQGVRYEIRVSNDAIRALQESKCFYAP